MRLRKQKQEPFFVKRVRLRKSILKTNEILETISNYEYQSSKYSTLSSAFQSQEIELKDKKSSLPLNRATINQLELITSKSSWNKMKNINNIIKICNQQRHRDAMMEMNKAGIEARRIFADPEHKRMQCSSEDRRKHKKEQSCSRPLNLTLSIDGFECGLSPKRSQIKKQTQIQKQIESLIKSSSGVSPSRRNKVYLYQRMAQMQITSNNQQNHIYQRRIRSYCEFLWKSMLAHNVYIELDLEPSTVSNKKYKPYKAYVGFGNNSNMIKGLLKRRFWWTISQEMDDDCNFVWTQLKINKIFEKQQRAPKNMLLYSNQDIFQEHIEDLRITQSSNLKKRSRDASKMISKNANDKFNQSYVFHRKIWNNQDFDFLKSLFKPRGPLEEKEGGKQKSYHYKTSIVKKKYKFINELENFANLQYDGEQTHNYYRVKPLIHNHLQNNFYLGNKKALFYNLKQYYSKNGENVFDYIPLTFHIKQGINDPQYKNFTKYYEQRAKIIRKEEKNDVGKNKKSRNIWIVKPGENSNQGRGITVIDQIYELDRIIKQANTKTKSKGRSDEDNCEARTFIVQLYLDKPLLYNDRKFDIRHYMLITNLYGCTRAYWYEEGYVRTSAYRFDIHTFDPQIHLTNDAIQKHYPQYGRYEAANKISYSDLQNYISASGEKRCNFKQQILNQMKKIGKDAARSIYGKMNPQNQMHNFQIFGLDFMIDQNFKPWLIEINTNPCLECVCPLLDRIIPYMVELALKLSIDLVYPPPTHYPNTSKHYAPLISLDTFKYQLIFDSISEGQQIDKIFSKQSKRGNSLENDIGIIQDDEQFKDEGKQIKLDDFT